MARAMRRALALLALCVSTAAADGPQDLGLDAAVFEEGFCTSEDKTPLQEFSVSGMECSKLMEFVFITRSKTWEQLEQLRMQAHSGAPTTWKVALRSVSKGSSTLSAHVHILAAIASQRSECFSEHVRLLLIVNLRRLKALATSHTKLLWLVSQNGPGQEEVFRLQRAWLTEATELLDADLRTMKTVLRAWSPPVIEEARFYSHEADGRFSTMEALRRDTFDEWPLDRGLLQGLLRHVLPVDAIVGDLGAGSGHYAKWLNDTGLVTALAFDGSPDIELVTKGVVSSADLGKPTTLWRTFDWVMCLEVAEHIQPELTATFLKNLEAHASIGLVLSWARPSLLGAGYMNPQTEEETLRLLREHTGLQVDEALTNKLRAAATVPALAETVIVLTKEPGSGTCAAGDASCSAGPLGSGSGACESEDGWIYAGNDVQMYNDVVSAASCCDLCSQHEQCKYWTWSRDPSHKDLCWIKSTREYRINHNGFISGTPAAKA